MRPKRPKGLTMTRMPDLVVPLEDGEHRTERWLDMHRAISVCVSVDIVNGEAWHHVSISGGHNDKSRAFSPRHQRRILRAFDMLGAEEDGTREGAARHYWQRVDASEVAA